MTQMPYPGAYQQPQSQPGYSPPPQQSYAQPGYPQQPAQQYQAPTEIALPTFEDRSANSSLFDGSPTAAANLRSGLRQRVVGGNADLMFPSKGSTIVRLLTGIRRGSNSLLPYRDPTTGAFTTTYTDAHGTQKQDCWFMQLPIWRGGHNTALALLCADMREGTHGSPIVALIDAARQMERTHGPGHPWATLLKGGPGRGADLGNAQNYILVRALLHQFVGERESAQYDPPRGLSRPLVLALRADNTWGDFERWAAANPQADPIALDSGVFWEISQSAAARPVQIVGGGAPGGGAAGGGGVQGNPYHMTPTQLTHAQTGAPVSPVLAGTARMQQLVNVLLPWDHLLDAPTREEQVDELVNAFPTDLCLFAWASHPEWLERPSVRARKATPLGMKAQAATTLPANTVVGQQQPSAYGAGYQPPLPPPPAYGGQYPGAVPGQPAPAYSAPPPLPGYGQSPAPTTYVAPPPAPTQAPQQSGYGQPQTAPAPAPVYAPPPPAPVYAPPPAPTQAPQQSGYGPPQTAPAPAPVYVAPAPAPVYAPPPPAPASGGPVPDAAVAAMFSAPPGGTPSAVPAADALAAYRVGG